jgi:hypothetical protein
MAYVTYFIQGFSELGVKEFDPVDELVLLGGLFGLLQKGQYLMVIPINKSGLVVVEDSHVGLESFDYVIQKAVVLLDVFL